MNTEPVVVEGREIPEAAIAAEAQQHPAPDAHSARAAAARALAVRQLLLNEAERQGIVTVFAHDQTGRPLTPEDARIESLLAKAIQTPRADEETCRRYYERHRECFVSLPLVEAAHILIEADPADAFAYGLATGDARTLIRKLKAEPGRFAELACSHSACSSHEQGGNLGQVSPGQLVAAFDQALFSLPEHTLCPYPIRSPFGIHVIRSGRRTEGRQRPFEAVHERIGDYLEEASFRLAAAQYIRILADRAVFSGVAFGEQEIASGRVAKSCGTTGR